MTARSATRAVASALAAVSIVLAAAGGVLAADPSPKPTVGGRLSIGVDNAIEVYSGGNVPARVTMSAESPDVRLSETTFLLDPGQQHALTFTGPAVGRLYAHFETILPPSRSQETGTTTLALNLKPYTPPFPWGAAIFSVTLALGTLLLLLRAFRWARTHLRYVPAPAPVVHAPKRVPHGHQVPAGMHAYLKPLDRDGNAVEEDTDAPA